MAEWLVGKASDIKEGDRKVVTAGKREIGIFHKGGAFYGYSNTCLQQGGPACEGMITQNVVDVIDKDHLYQGQTYGDEVHFVCPWHGYEYDLKTGECIGDRKLKLRKYEIVKRGEEIYVVAGRGPFDELLLAHAACRRPSPSSGGWTEFAALTE